MTVNYSEIDGIDVRLTVAEAGKLLAHKQAVETLRTAIVSVLQDGPGSVEEITL